MRCDSLLFFIAIIGGSWRLGRPTCVLESDFGFVLNCAFRKSGLLRVRNLGGVKAHIGLGLTVGDELGFKESLSTIESDRRRSPPRNKTISTDTVSSGSNKSSKKLSTLSLTDVPPFKPISPAQERATGPQTTHNLSEMLLTPEQMYSKSKTTITSPTVVGIAPMQSTMKRNMFINNTDRSSSVIVTSNSSLLKETQSRLQSIKHPNTLLMSTSNLDSLYESVESARNDTMPTAFKRKQLIKTEPNSLKITPMSTTTFAPPINDNPNTNSVGKVMNAPKEYYPVGYAKNFDDHFASRVELPETSFRCANQKHFAGLYADEDLGCMVFHLCALTNKGLTMKSFLCPESTLFDQAILKCNWWFYVECRNSHNLYDSNIPISKSYQLMKALTFFTGYKT